MKKKKKKKIKLKYRDQVKQLVSWTTLSGSNHKTKTCPAKLIKEEKCEGFKNVVMKMWGVEKMHMVDVRFNTYWHAKIQNHN